jgi:teichuronic acid exporter
LKQSVPISSSFLWSAIDQLINFSFSLFIGIFLARFLSPADFGLVGIVMIFIVICDTLVNSGFYMALIRKDLCSNQDYSTAFFFNVLISLALYVVLFLTSEWVAVYFSQAQLTTLIRVSGLVLIFDAFSLVQRAHLARELNYKILTRISMLSLVVSGLISIIMALNGYGVWSLVFNRLIGRFLVTILHWYWCKFYVSFSFNWNSFIELFSFGSKLMLSSLISAFTSNAYFFVIGKFMSSLQLGYFTKAQELASIPAKNIEAIVSRVSFPVFSRRSEDKDRLLNNYIMIIRTTMFITFLLMFGLIAISDSLIVILLGEKWIPSIFIFQMLAVIYSLLPIQSLNLSILNVYGMSDRFLKLEIVKTSLTFGTIIFGYLWGMEIMLWSMIFSSVLSLYINSFWSGKVIGYNFVNQLRDISVSLCIAGSMCFFISYLGDLLNGSLLFKLSIQVLVSFLYVGVICKYFVVKEFFFLIDIVLSQLKIFSSTIFKA